MFDLIWLRIVRKRKKERYTERWRDKWHLLFYSPNGPDSQGWARPKTENGTSFLLSYLGSSNCSSRNTLFYLPRIIEWRLDWKWGSCTWTSTSVQMPTFTSSTTPPLCVRAEINWCFDFILLLLFRNFLIYYQYH